MLIKYTTYMINFLKIFPNCVKYQKYNNANAIKTIVFWIKNVKNNVSYYKPKRLKKSIKMINKTLIKKKASWLKFVVTCTLKSISSFLSKE